MCLRSGCVLTKQDSPIILDSSLDTVVYIDGLNLQTRFLDRLRPQHVDLFVLLKKTLPSINRITAMKYFTSRLQVPEDMKHQDKLIDYHLNKYKGKFHVTYGTFITRKFRWKFGCGAPVTFGEIILEKLTEKATDVNLACHMINDSFDSSFKCSVIVTNDSDFVTALSMTRKNGKHVILVSPVRRPLNDLRKRCDIHLSLKKTDAIASFITQSGS